MQLQNVFLAVFIFYTSSLICMNKNLITLPNSETLRNSFKKTKKEDFIRHSPLITLCANQQKTVHDIYNTVEQCWKSYISNKLKDKSNDEISDIIPEIQNLRSNIAVIYAALLQEYPQKLMILKSINHNF